MAKIREERIQNRRKRNIIRFAIGTVATFVAALGIGAGISTIEVPEKEQEVLQAQPGFQMHGVDETIIPEMEEELDTIDIIMVGDMLMHEPILESGKQADGSYNFDHLFVNVREEIQDADLAIANQETIMGGPDFGYTGYPSFNTPYELSDAQVKAGFDLLLFATNHAMDKGSRAILNCMDYIEEYHPQLGYTGINRSQKAQNEDIYIYEKNGMKIAVLNYTYGTNGIPLPGGMPYLVNLLKEEKVRSQIQRAEEIADFTIVCPHWGTEYNLGVSMEQKTWTKIFLEEGVDLVLGTHPHVIEPIEWVKDESGHEMLVYYSLGNYVNGTSSTGHGVTNRMIGGMAEITLRRNEAGEVKVDTYGARELVCHMAEGSGYTVYYMEDYTEKLASENLIRYQDSEFSKALCEDLFYQVWGE